MFKDEHTHKGLQKIPPSNLVLPAQRGIVLISSMLVMGLLTLLGITSLKISNLQLKLTDNIQLAAQAEYAAEFGVNEAISSLLNTSIDEHTISNSPHIATIDGIDQAYVRRQINTAGYSTQYDILIKSFLNPQQAPGNSNLSDTIALRSSKNPIYRILSTGTSDSAHSLLDVAVAMQYSSFFKSGLEACYGVQFEANSTIDSYSSSGNLGAGHKGGISTLSYLDECRKCALGDDSHKGKIHVGSDTRIQGPVSATGSLSLESNAIISGDAFANGSIELGFDSSIEQSAYSNAQIRGQITGSVHPGQTSEVVTPETCDPLGLAGESGIFKIGEHKDHQRDSVLILPDRSSNDNQDLVSNAPQGSSTEFNYHFDSQHTPGDIIGISGQTRKYYFESFTIDVPSYSSSFQAEIRGDVVMFIDGDFTLKDFSTLKLGTDSTLTIFVSGRFSIESNAQIKGDATPASLRIFSNAENDSNFDTGTESDTPMVHIQADSGFSGAIYAPYSHIVLGSASDIYGAVRGKWITVKQGTRFHYDEDLHQIADSSPTGYEIIYWTQKKPD